MTKKKFRNIGLHMVKEYYCTLVEIILSDMDMLKEYTVN